MQLKLKIPSPRQACVGVGFKLRSDSAGVRAASAGTGQREGLGLTRIVRECRLTVD